MYKAVSKGFDRLYRGADTSHAAERRGLRFVLLVCLGLVAFSVATCQPANSFPWSTDMFRGQSVRPLELTPRNQPPGTLSENAIRPMSREQAAASLHNPLQPDKSVIAQGRVLYLTDCAPCHDSHGTGHGPVRDVLSKPPADLTSVQIRKLSDGFIFWTIRNGGKQMSPYGDTISAKEVWEVVSYVRHLQKSDGKRAER